MTIKRVKIFSRFERFWHWSQAALLFVMIFTGFGMHGVHRLFHFGDMLTVHVGAALTLLLLWFFAIFWHLTTGQWRHYVPTANGIGAMLRFHAYGIFAGAEHPYRKTWRRKHNPLQALAYLVFKLVLSPALWITGLAMLLYDLWKMQPWAPGMFGVAATIHTAAAFLLVVFLIGHIYLITTGRTVGEQLKAMITGYDEVDVDSVDAAALKRDHLLQSGRPN